MQRLFCLIVAAGLALGGVAYAHGPGFGRDPEKTQDRIELLTVWKMMDALDLDNATAEKVLEIRRKFVAKRRELQKSMEGDFAKLRSLLREPRQEGEEKELAGALANIRAKRKQLKDLWVQHYDEVSKVLTVRQQAELVLFLKDWHRELHRMLRPMPGRPPGPGGKLEPPMDPEGAGP